MAIQYLTYIYIIFFDNYLNFQIITGTKVAAMKDKNNNDCGTKDGKKSKGKIMPTSMLFEKSGVGNRRNPANNPKIIER